MLKHLLSSVGLKSMQTGPLRKRIQVRPFDVKKETAMINLSFCTSIGSFSFKHIPDHSPCPMQAAWGQAPQAVPCPLGSHSLCHSRQAQDACTVAAAAAQETHWVEIVAQTGAWELILPIEANS